MTEVHGNSDASFPEVEWRDPPPDRRGRAPGPIATNNYSWFYKKLCENPNRWAIYPGTSGAAQGWASRHDGFEVTCRGTNGNQTAYMRFVGEVTA